MGTDIFDGIHLCVGRVQSLVALELLARGVGTATLTTAIGTARPEGRSSSLFFFLGRLALRPAARQRADCGKNELKFSFI